MLSRSVVISLRAGVERSVTRFCSGSRIIQAVIWKGGAACKFRSLCSCKIANFCYEGHRPCTCFLVHATNWCWLSSTIWCKIPATISCLKWEKSTLYLFCLRRFRMPTLKWIWMCTLFNVAFNLLNPKVFTNCVTPVSHCTALPFLFVGVSI